MTTTVKFNKGNQKVSVTNLEILEKTENLELKNYLVIRESYSNFCKNQTKSGQARKNERATIRRKMFDGINTVLLDEELLKILKIIKLEKENLLEKITVEIEYDQKKSSNLSKIIEGIKMYIFTGSLSPQYYGLGLIEFEIK